MSNPNDQRRRELEDEVLAMDAKLDPTDQSVAARHIRETAASIRDHRSSPRRSGQGPRRD